MCLHRGCGKRRSQKYRKCEGQDKVGKRGNLLPELVAVAVSFRLQNFLIAAAIKRFNSAFGFFDSSCYENSKYGILIAATMDHRYENSAHFGSHGQNHERATGPTRTSTFFHGWLPVAPHKLPIIGCC